MAMILDAFVGNLKSKLSAMLEEEVMTVLGAEQELRKLQRNMERFNLVLQDAEGKRIQSKAIAGWVKELKDVVYDADDIIDLCRYDGGRLLKDQPPSSSTPWVRCSFPSLLSCFSSLISWFSDVRFRDEIGGRIKDLNARLDEIYERVPALNLLQNEPDVRATIVDRRQTSPDVDPSQVVGKDMERATEELVELIVQEDHEQKCRVIAVTGMGGIGKTTLAQIVFKHQRIKDGFLIKIWVCISQNFSETDLLKEIIRGAGGNTGDLQSKAELLPLLKSVISGKTCFLILDDVWRADVWNALLRTPLQIGAICSRVLVTTRDRRVAVQMGAKLIHPVEGLPLESGWELLCKNAFITAEAEMQSLRYVGVQIVEKCHGLPLAIKAIAGVLATKARSRGEWEKILRRDAWSVDNLPDDVRGALYLSYEDLPSPLKQCFIYLSLFPEDSEFSRQDVVNYWAVEGLAETPKDLFVEKADEYFEELILRNLIQYSSNDVIGRSAFYKMHDLLRQLACFLSRDESFCGKAHELTSVSTRIKLRRLAIRKDSDDIAVDPKSLAAHKKLRTIFLDRIWWVRNDLFVSFPCLRLLSLRDSQIDNIPGAVGDLIHLRFLDLGNTRVSSLPGSIENLTNLQVLRLSGSEIDNIPDAVGNLRHLRLLDLDRTKVSGLPGSIKNLTNLQVLRLSGCRSLHTFPDGITRLGNLRFIHLRDTTLNFMPAGMGRLELLNFFEGFSVGVSGTRSDEHQEQGCELEELVSLMQLRELTICNLERLAVARMGGHDLVLMDKPHLQYLELECTSVRETDEALRNIEEVFAQLFPPSCLERLRIQEYSGRLFPDWMMSLSLATYLPQLRVLYLTNCKNVLHLPPLGQLPELVHLEIFCANEVVTVRPDYFGSDKCAVPEVYFPKVEVLEIGGMLKLEEWSFCGDEGKEVIMFPCLRRLSVSHCPKLKSDLKLSALKELYIEECKSMERISGLPTLRRLVIRKCPSLICVENVDALEYLELNDRRMECLPEWLLGLLQQRSRPQQHQDDKFELELRCNKKLLKRCFKECEYWPTIRNIPRVTADSMGGGRMVYMKHPFQYQIEVREDDSTE